MNKLFIVLFSCLLALQSAVASDMSADKKAAIERLLAQTGQSSAAVGQQFASELIRQMSAMLKRAKPQIDPRAFTIIQEETEALIREDFIESNALNDIIGRIYSRHFSLKEIQAIVAFYDTPVGRKLIQLMPDISREGILAGQEMGQSLAPTVQRRIQARFRAEGIR